MRNLILDALATGIKVSGAVVLATLALGALSAIH